MPAKNSIRQFIENGYYHIYNRGVEKRNIFPDEEDYSVFLQYLKNCLSYQSFVEDHQEDSKEILGSSALD